MKTYLVTGAAGFIGANYIKYILAKHEASTWHRILREFCVLESFQKTSSPGWV